MWDEIIHSFRNFDGVWMDIWFHLTFYWSFEYLSMLGSKLIHVGKRGASWVGRHRVPWNWFCFSRFSKDIWIISWRCFSNARQINKGKSKTGHDRKVIMYPAYGTHHRLRTVRGNKIQLTQNPSELQQRQHRESVQTIPPDRTYEWGAGYHPTPFVLCFPVWLLDWDYFQTLQCGLSQGWCM